VCGASGNLGEGREEKKKNGSSSLIGFSEGVLWLFDGNVKDVLSSYEHCSILSSSINLSHFQPNGTTHFV